jgi:hypothetical protein
VERHSEGTLGVYTQYICVNRNLTLASSLCHLGGVDSGLPAVQEKRTNFRKRVLKTAHIILSDKDQSWIAPLETFRIPAPVCSFPRRMEFP